MAESLTSLAAELCTTREAVHAALRDITHERGPLAARDALERITVGRQEALVGEQHVLLAQPMEIYVKPAAADLVRLMLCPCVDDRDAPGFDPLRCQATSCHAHDELAGIHRDAAQAVQERRQREGATMSDPPVCPVCVHLDCPDCGHRQANVGRVWVRKAGRVYCPKCGHGGGLTQVDTRHRPGTQIARNHAEMAPGAAELLKELPRG